MLVRGLIAAVLLVASVGARPAAAASEERSIRTDAAVTLDVGTLREEALARLAPQVRAALRGVRLQIVARPIPRTAPGAAACFDLATGAILLGADIEDRYGHEFARSALMHEYGHALAWVRLKWDHREFRARFVSAMSMPGTDKYPVFSDFLRRHAAEMANADYSEVFPAVLLEMRSASVLPPPLRSYLAPLMWP